MTDITSISGYRYEDAETNASHEYLVPELKKILDQHFKIKKGVRVFDLGCGNGSVTSMINRMGFEVAGVDPSVEGIQQANETYPNLNLKVGSAYDDLPSAYGLFQCVVSLEVVEHVYNPRFYAKTAYSLLKKDGIAIISTPYHSYLKNLALALTGKMDRHFTALWDHGHIKFWSIDTLGSLLKEAGFQSVEFRCVGRIPPLAKSMIAIARK